MKIFRWLIIFMLFEACAPTSEEGGSASKAVAEKEVTEVDQKGPMFRGKFGDKLGGGQMQGRPGQGGPGGQMPERPERSGGPPGEKPERGSAGGKNDPACIDEDKRSHSRVLNFSDCDYVMKHIGLSGVAHNAGSAVKFDGKKNANHFLLKNLGVYDIEPVEKDDDSDDESLELDDDGTTTFTIDGDVLNVDEETVTVEREFIVHVPDDYDESLEYPVVFAFHGHGGNSTQWESSLGDLIDEFEFIGVYPKGYQDAEAEDDHGNPAQTSWNLGKEVSTADDVVFVNDIIERLKSITPDASKRFALGSSNGAALSHFLAANAKEKIFEGIGTMVSGLIKSTLEESDEITIPVSGKTYHFGLSEDSIPLNVVTVFGMVDPIIPYCGGESKTGTINYSAEETIRAWAKLAGCSKHDSREVETFESDSTTEIDLSDY